MMSCPFPLSIRTQNMRGSAIREMLKQLDVPGMISFAGGNPAPESFPTQLFAGLQQRVFERYGHKALQYSATEGFAPLREAIAERLRAQGIPADANRILITNGSQGALDALSKVLLDVDTPLGVESPTYLGALQSFSPYQPNFITLETDDEGATPQSLRALFSEHPHGIAYLMPTFQNPSGRMAGLTRRCELAQVIEEYPCLVIEDEPYHSLRYESDEQIALASLCPDRVVYMGTLSKVFAPGLRLGFCLAPEWLFPWLVKAKQGTDLHTSTLSQAMAAEYIQGGFLDEQLPKTIAIYRSRRNAMLDALSQFLPMDFQFTRPHGGMFIWVEGPKSFDAEACLQKALLAKVAFVVGSAFYPNHPSQLNAQMGRNCFRLNFTMPTESQIFEGIRKLTQVLGICADSQ